MGAGATVLPGDGRHSETLEIHPEDSEDNHIMRYPIVLNEVEKKREVETGASRAGHRERVEP